MDMMTQRPDSPPALRVASYNIRKAVGLDRRRDPARIVEVLAEIAPDIAVLQEVDTRVPPRRAVLSPASMEAHAGLRLLDPSVGLGRTGFHGNTIALAPYIELLDLDAIDLPGLEPRGAVLARLGLPDGELFLVGCHLPLVATFRREAVARLVEVVRGAGDARWLIAGDLNEPRPLGALAPFAEGARILPAGLSFHTRMPRFPLDRFILSPELTGKAHVHRSAAARIASDHFPVVATLTPA
jgi:endonuclease/exonuclease/phosphatase family metal-dependent hydrolase